MNQRQKEQLAEAQEIIGKNARSAQDEREKTKAELEHIITKALDIIREPFHTTDLEFGLGIEPIELGKNPKHVHATVSVKFRGCESCRAHILINKRDQSANNTADDYHIKVLHPASDHCEQIEDRIIEGSARDLDGVAILIAKGLAKASENSLEPKASPARAVTTTSPKSQA